MKDNPIVQILLAVLIFLVGGALGGMYVKIQYLEGKAGAPVAQTGQAAQGAAGAGQVAGAAGEAQVPIKEVVVKQEDAVKGDPNAKLVVVEYADYQCPFCGRFHKDVYPQIIKDFVDTGKVKFVYKNLAFLGKESTDAANAALCAKEQNKFWEYHDHLYNNQNGENQGAFAIDKLKGFAAELGLNATQFNSCLDGAKYNDQVTADMAEANANGFNSTPSTAVGITPIIGAQPYATFKAAIETELAKKT